MEGREEGSKAAASARGRGRPRSERSPQKGVQNVVSFRVDKSRLRELEEGAKATGVSTNEYARIRLFDALDGKREEEILRQQRRAAGELDLLREDIASTVEVILLNLLKSGSEAEIRRWISMNLRRTQDEG